jgi:2'-hydroxyisoflavone reductase
LKIINLGRSNFHDMTTRRKFLGQGLKAAALVPFACNPCTKGMTSSETTNRAAGEQKLKILVLGGTSFLGPHQIAYAIDRGHSVSTFTRGKTSPTVNSSYFDRVEKLIGDRENDLEALKNREWDVVIDNSGRKVEWTRATAELLKAKAKQYIYVSSVSVFYPYFTAGVDEDKSVVLEMPKSLESGEEYLYEYGIMKANSELVASEVFGRERTTVVRPTFMMGPADRTDRFLYWPTQLAKGGQVILPGAKADPVQWIDVRDIAEWMIRLGETATPGTFNGVGPASNMTCPAFVYGAHAAFGSSCQFIKIDDYEFLEANNLSFAAPWVLQSPKFHGMSRVRNDRAISSGLTFRPLASTIKDTHDWWYSEAVSSERRTKYEENANELHNRAAALIAKWKKTD